MPAHILRLFALLAVLVCGFELYEAINPPFTDDQIRSSNVDTVDVYAIWNVIVSAVMAAISIASLIIALMCKKPRIWLAATTAILAAGCAVLLTYANHHALVLRAAELTVRA